MQENNAFFSSFHGGGTANRDFKVVKLKYKSRKLSLS